MMILWIPICMGIPLHEALQLGALGCDNIYPKTLHLGCCLCEHTNHPYTLLDQQQRLIRR